MPSGLSTPLLSRAQERTLSRGLLGHIGAAACEREHRAIDTVAFCPEQGIEVVGPGPCRQFGPVFDAASEQHTDITFTKVDTEKEPELSGGLGISSIPTLMAFRDGILLYSQPGALPSPSLEQLIEAVRNADMDDVRAKVAEQQSSN